MKIKLDIPPGVHIPFEYCEKCEVKDKCAMAFSEKVKKDNKIKEEIREYLLDIGIKVHTYDTPHKMFDKLHLTFGGLKYSHPDDKRGYKLTAYSDILILLGGKNALNIIEITENMYNEMYKELKEKGKITPILSFFFAEVQK